MADRGRSPARAGRRRTWIQAAAAALFLACFVLAALGATAPLPVDLFFLADPLLAATGALAARRVLLVPLLAGAAALVATALLGRVFCGYLCPLGTLQDWTAARAGRGSRRAGRTDLARWRWIGRALLAAVAAAALVGVPAAWLLDPLALLWRALALAVYPLALDASALGVGAARSALGAFLPTTPLAFSMPHRAFAGAVLSAALLALVLLLGRVVPRFWCRVACPLGALLSLVAVAPWLRRRVAGGRCLSCSRCAAACPMGHLGGDPLAASPEDCLLCLRCADACPVAAVSAGLGGARPAPPVATGDLFPAKLRLKPTRGLRRRRLADPERPLPRDSAVARSYRPEPKPPQRSTGSPPSPSIPLPPSRWERDAASRFEALPRTRLVRPELAPIRRLDRRRFLGGAACGFGSLVIADRLPWGAPRSDRSAPLRPPGSRPEAELLDRCLRCGTCMQACPTNAIQPDVAPASFGGFFAPVLVLRRGGCVPECTRCGEVCPSGALEALSPEEKRRWVVGTAVVEAERCLRADGRDCRACAEACPWDAVELTPGRARVVVGRCTGCGLCELRCPAPPAIRVLTVAEAARRTPPEPVREDSHLPLFLRTSS